MSQFVCSKWLMFGTENISFIRSRTVDFHHCSVKLGSKKLLTKKFKMKSLYFVVFVALFGVSDGMASIFMDLHLIF